MSGDRLQHVPFPLEEVIISILTDSRQNIPEDVADTVQFKTSQTLAVVWDQDNGERYWCIAFYLGVSHTEDYIIVDYLLQCLIKTEKNNEWFRPMNYSTCCNRRLAIYYWTTFVWYGQFTEHWVLISRTFCIDICSNFCFKIVFIFLCLKQILEPFCYVTINCIDGMIKSQKRFVSLCTF